MPTTLRAFASAFVILLLLAACSPGASGTVTPGPSTSGPAATIASPLATEPAPSAAAAGEPCSYLSAAEVGTIVTTTPVEVAERIGRGDCDYWLSAARDSKVNIGVFTGAEATSYFDTTKEIGTPEPVDIGDEAYAIFNASIGTVVVARTGDTVVAVQVFTADADNQLAQATAIVEAVFGGL